MPNGGQRSPLRATGPRYKAAGFEDRLGLGVAADDRYVNHGYGVECLCFFDSAPNFFLRFWPAPRELQATQRA